MSDEESRSADLESRIRDYRRSINGFSRLVTAPASLERLMQHLTAQVSRAAQIRRVKVLRYRPETSDLLVVAGVGWKDGVVGHATLGTDMQSPPGRSIQTSAPVAIEDLPNDREYRYSDLLREHGVISVLNVPVMIDGQSWGVLEVDTEKRCVFDEWDVDFLTTMANILGCALARHKAEQDAITAAFEIKTANARSEIAMRELQHRAKNNLQLVISLLTASSRQSGSDEVREIIGSAIGRVQAIAVAHDLLSRGKQGSSVEFAQYLRALCASITPSHRDIVLDVDAMEATIPLDRAVPAGLIVNELVTNSMKYAFDNVESEGRRIQVKFVVVGNGSEACISVEDNGRGMSLPPQPGYGMRLIEALARQLSGRLEYAKVEVGARTVLCFPFLPS